MREEREKKEAFLKQICRDEALTWIQSTKSSFSFTSL